MKTTIGRALRSASFPRRWAMFAFACAAAGGCSSPPERFESPDQAVSTLVSALRTDDEKQLQRILGSDAKALLSSGDDVADTNGRAEFMRMYDEKHALVPHGEDLLTLEVGDTEWPLPIPLVRRDGGWSFDTAAGLDEMLSRRIGENELSAIQVCLAIVDAQREFAAADFNGDGWREYATQFGSEPGKRNGLYWKAAEGEAESPLGELAAEAAAEGYSGARRAKDGLRPYHGYYYRILTSQGPSAPGGGLDYMAQGRMIGGFGVIAWPAEYGNSGIKSFLTSFHGVVYERDLGEDTDSIAPAMESFDPGPGWERCEQPSE